MGEWAASAASQCSASLRAKWKEEFPLLLATLTRLYVKLKASVRPYPSKRFIKEEKFPLLLLNLTGLKANMGDIFDPYPSKRSIAILLAAHRPISELKQTT